MDIPSRRTFTDQNGQKVEVEIELDQRRLDRAICNLAGKARARKSKTASGMSGGIRIKVIRDEKEVHG